MPDTDRGITDVTVAYTVHFVKARQSATMLTLEQPAPPCPSGRIPRVSRLMALAIRFDGLLRDGTITDCADLARLGHVSRARITQIMALLHLAPDIQEALISLPRVTQGKDPITEHQIRPIAAEPRWHRQREMWRLVRQ